MATKTMKTPEGELWWMVDANYPEDSGAICTTAKNGADAERQALKFLNYETPESVSVYPVTEADVDALQELVDVHEKARTILREGLVHLTQSTHGFSPAGCPACNAAFDALEETKR